MTIGLDNWEVVHSSNKHLSSIYFVPGTALDAENTAGLYMNVWKYSTAPASTMVGEDRQEINR